MELTRIRCSMCGEPLNEAVNGFYKCSYCNSTFRERITNKEIEKIITILDDNKQEQLANAKKNLYNVTHEKYLSKERIKDAVNRVKELYSDDLMANFYDAFLVGKEETLKYLENFDVKANSSYLTHIINFLLIEGNLNFSYVTILKDFVDNAPYTKEGKYQINTRIENECQKLNDGVYNLDIIRDVFICYKSKDIKAINEITNYLESQGLTCFVALRNLRHGVGSVENYDELIYKAMRNCRCLVFLSSKNSRSFDCEAITKELPYLRDNLKDKPRIEYLIDEYTDNENRAALSIIKQTFDGYEWAKDKQDVLDRVVKIITTKKEEKKEECKYCINCLSKNTLTSKFCVECGSNDFRDSLEEAKLIFNNKNSKPKEEEKKYCVSCLSANPINTKFCQECGSTEFKSTLNEASVLYKQKMIQKAKEEAEAERKKKEEQFKKLKGSIYKLGKYPQFSDTPEPIEWDVLDVVDGKALLFAHKILDAHRFDKESNNYANSEIRAWLNNDFLNKAFTKEEQERILITEVDNSERSTNPYNNSSKWNNGKNEYACNNTQDKIFLLSQYEITNPNYGFNEDPGNYDIKRRKQPTKYAKKNGAWTYDENYKYFEPKYKGNGLFFHRSPRCDNAQSAYCGNYNGLGLEFDAVSDTAIGLAPALWIKI